MFEDWIKEKQTATDHEIETAFGLDTSTQKRWRLKKEGPMHFYKNKTILYPRAIFVEWFLKHCRNKPKPIVHVVSDHTKQEQIEN